MRGVMPTTTPDCSACRPWPTGGVSAHRGSFEPTEVRSQQLTYSEDSESVVMAVRWCRRQCHRCSTSAPTSTMARQRSTSAVSTQSGWRGALRDRAAGALYPEAIVIAPLERLATNPLIRPSDISFVRASGTFNPGVTVDRARDKVVLLVRVFEEASRRSLLGLALSADGEHIDEIWDRPAVARDAPYEHWGVEDARITYLEDEKRYAITYTGYSRDGPRVCLITTDDLLSPTSYRRHGPRIAGDNKNCVIFPEKVDGKYVILHRPMPRVVCIKVSKLEKPWPTDGVTLIGP